LYRDKLAHLLASKLAASFGLKFGEKFLSSFLATFAMRFLPWSVQQECRKLPGRHRRVLRVDSG
jgi:hypothetical protein